MTEQGKINRAKAQSGGTQPSNSGPASLFERADATFGLDGLNLGGVPGGLPEARPRPARRPAPAAPSQLAPARDPQPYGFEPQDHAPHSPADAPQARPAERTVKLSGARQRIDRETLRAEGLIVPEDPVSGLLEEFRIVKRELLADARASDEAAARRILVCSPHPGEGKTYCAINLAIALAAERGIEVVLVDADVLSPSVPARLGITPGKGLMDCLLDPRLRPEELVIATDVEGLFVLPAGSRSALDAEYLASTRTAEVLARLTSGAPNRFIIFDTPPALAASPAAELAAHVGQAVLVVRADQTNRAALEDAQQLLSACPDIKLLLNAARFSPSGRQFGGYGEKEQ